MNLLRVPNRLRVGCALALVFCAGCDGGGGSNSAAALQYDCSVFPAAASSQYILPWRVGETHQVSPHAARETSVQRYAIDTGMPIGTDVIAARDGIVVRIEESFVDGDNVLGHENYVFVEHVDGTVARYVHLTNAGALVQIGDSVRQGDLIAHSGHTGNSSGPHLHFDVTQKCCTTPPNYNELPFGETLPTNFRNAGEGNASPAASNLSCGLLLNKFYTAFP